MAVENIKIYHVTMTSVGFPVKKATGSPMESELAM